VEIGEACSVFSNGVYILGFDYWVAIAAEPIGTVLIGDEKHKVWLFAHLAMTQ
jgi:hypothetical protein